MNNPIRLNEIKELIKGNNIGMLCLVGTKIKEGNKAMVIHQQLHKRRKWENMDLLGSELILSDKKMGNKVNDNMEAISLHNKAGFHLTIIYAANDFRER